MAAFHFTMSVLCVVTAFLCFKSVAGISIEGPKGSTDIEIYGTENKVDVQYNTYHGKDPFTHVNFKKSDIKIVNDKANKVGIDRKMFGNYIHEIKKDLGMKANQNFTYQELVELAEELLKMTK